MEASSIRRLVAGWGLAALVILLVAITGLVRADTLPGPVPVLVAVGLVAATTLVRADLQLASRSLAMNLSEVGLVASFALLEPAAAIVAAVGGWILANLIQRVGPLKLLFNAAAATVGAGLAAVVVVATGGGPIDVTTVTGLLVAVGLLVVYGVVGVVAATSLIARLDEAAYRDVLPDVAIVAGMTTALSGSVGILAVVLAAVAPHAVPLLVVVLGLIQLTLRDRMVRIEQEVLEHERLERVVDGARDGIALLDAAGRIELANPALRAYLGGSDDPDLIGDRLAAVLARRAGEPPVAAPPPATTADHGSEPAALAGPVDAAPESGRLSVALAEMTAADPHLRHDVVLDDRTLALLLTGLFDHHGRRLGTIVLVVDVTEERERETLREELLARVSHELRTPLTAIGGFAETLRERGADLDPGDRSRYLDIVALQAGRLERLVDDLLWTSRIQRDRVTTAPVAVPVATAVAEVVEVFGPQLRYPVEVAVPTQMTVHADPDHLQQILGNLLRNADTYGQPPVLVTAAAAGDRVVIGVVDRGAGVPPAFVPALFEAFEQASVGVRRTAQGLGLGLAIVRALAEANDGTVRYRRADGRTRFEVELPGNGAERP